MSKLPIIKYPAPVLREQCTPVAEFNQELGQLIDNMFETMYAGQGIGLAGPQVDVTKRIVTVDLSSSGKEQLELVNPEILQSEGKTAFEEGCLSIPGYRDYVTRSAWIKIKAQDRDGKDFELEAEELLAVCIQHEIDHLNGVLFVDRVSRLKRELFKRWYRKHGPLE